jgi:parallel beta-helix repeat protein
MSRVNFPKRFTNSPAAPPHDPTLTYKVWAEDILPMLSALQDATSGINTEQVEVGGVLTISPTRSFPLNPLRFGSDEEVKQYLEFLTGSPINPRIIFDPVTNKFKYNKRGETTERNLGSLNSIFDAKDDYGADNTGATDAAPAINNALQDASGNGIVYLPAGTYKIETPIYMVSNTKLIGADGAVLLMGGTSGHLVRDNASNPATNFTIENIVFDFNNVRSVSRAGIYIENSSYITIRKCTFKNFYPQAYSYGAIYAQSGASYITIEGCKFLDFQSDVGVSARGIMLFGTKEVSISNCVFKNILGVNWNSPGTGIRGEGIVIGYGARNIVIFGNIFDTVWYTAVQVGQIGTDVVTNVDIVGNAFYKVGWDGVKCNYARFINVSGNIFKETIVPDPDAYNPYTVRSGAEVYYMLVDGNIVNGAGGLGAFQSRYVSFTNNITYATPREGIEVNGDPNNPPGVYDFGNCLVANNFILFAGVSNTGNGIFASGSDITIVGNYIYSSKNHGIAISEGADRVKVSHNIILNSGRLAANTYDGIHVASESATSNAVHQNIWITDNASYDIGATKMQAYGLRIEAPGGDPNKLSAIVIANNFFAFNAVGSISLPNGVDLAKFKIFNNIENTGVDIAYLRMNTPLIIGARSFAPSQTSLMNGSFIAHINEAGNSLVFTVKYSDGTVKTGSIPLA